MDNAVVDRIRSLIAETIISGAALEENVDMKVHYGPRSNEISIETDALEITVSVRGKERIVA